MLTKEQAEHLLKTADLIYSPDIIEQAIQRMADEITGKMANCNPLVLCVMNGGVMFAGHLLPKLAFPLTLDCIRVSRYHNRTSGGALDWILFPQREEIDGRAVLVVDDILDEGITLAQIQKKVLEFGARSCHSAVLVDKNLDKTKIFQADFVGLNLPNRYVFGFGMDIHGMWRNLPAIYAINAESNQS